MTLSLRPGKPEDAAQCGAICYTAFKTIAEAYNFRPDIPSAESATTFLRFMLSQPGFYSLVAEEDGRIVGSNFLDERAKVAGLGPVTVDPAAQNKGIGRQLMVAMIERANQQGLAGIYLVQALFHSRSLALYTKLGFDPRETLSVMQGPPLGIELPGYRVRAAAQADLEACNRLCAAVHGYERGLELREAVQQGSATVVEHDGHICGYATLIGYPGHAVAENNESLKALIGAAKSLISPGFLLPTRNAELMRWCLGHGLKIVQPMMLMTLGLFNEPAGAYIPSID